VCWKDIICKQKNNIVIYTRSTQYIILYMIFIPLPTQSHPILPIDTVISQILKKCADRTLNYSRIICSSTPSRDIVRYYTFFCNNNKKTFPIPTPPLLIFAICTGCLLESVFECDKNF